MTAYVSLASASDADISDRLLPPITQQIANASYFGNSSRPIPSSSTLHSVSPTYLHYVTSETNS